MTANLLTPSLYPMYLYLSYNIQRVEFIEQDHIFVAAVLIPSINLMQ